MTTKRTLESPMTRSITNILQEFRIDWRSAKLLVNTGVILYKVMKCTSEFYRNYTCLKHIDIIFNFEDAVY